RITATRLAWDTPNVREVVNDIEVTEDGGIGDIARDRWISAQVRTRILTDGAIRDINYTIDTQNKVVYVLGIAQSQRELDRVLNHARSVAEVRRVVNYALLKDDPRRFAEPAGRYEDDDANATPPPETE
ncbi:MAG: BON domain-containing protein, partial [Alphaproteobacteria bacterium]|nr:BON domain-containing protein [Alphaproteobacteria bacterium]